jgi:hypothetical protein
VVAYIEGEPYISQVPVEPGLTNIKKKSPDGTRVIGLNTENVEINEGMVRFDIIFHVRMKDGLTKIIVNVEAQKNDPKKYQILNRAVFYVSRLISSQKERDFVNSNYDDIKQVISIWICMNMEVNSLCHIHLTKDELLDPYDWKGNIGLLNIAMIGITNQPPKHDERYELHRLLSVLLSGKINTKDKLNIIETEFDIPITENFRKEVHVMSNLAEGLKESFREDLTKDITEKVTKDITEFVTKNVTKDVTESVTKNVSESVNTSYILNMYRSNLPLDQIAKISEKTLEEVKAIIEKNISAPVKK